ncbi:MAG: cellulose synthase subunit BcsC-related outer membrane protein [Bacillota bacterium]|nr:cellulose synthase subunit BcsC-related outer membrane protein [Bacillota bacterium]
MEKMTRHILRTFTFTAALALPMGMSVQLLAQSAAEKALLEKAQKLAASGHPEMAAQTWEQVLLADPNNREALAGIARAEMQLGKAAEARRYLDRLRANGGSQQEINQILQVQRVQPRSERLEEAGRLAQEGNYAGAMQIYREVFGNKPPAGDVALAYYDTEAAIPSERGHAIEGLRSLMKQFPGDSRYAITLGRVLTYDPKTRAEGMAILRQYPQVQAAQAALHQAEAWNAQGASTANTLTAGQEAAPPRPAGNPLEAAAYRALNSGQLDEAREKFQELLAKQPRNAQALAGMGYLSMRQQDFVSASDYFERARAAGAHGLESAISNAHFWQKMTEAGNELGDGHTEAAIAAYHAALALKPNSVDALVGLGSAFQQAGEYTDAAQTLDKAVRQDPQRADAWRNLLLVESAANDPQGVADANTRIPRNVRAQLSSDPDYLRVLAQAYQALGRKADADKVISEALALPFPNEGRDMPVSKQLQYAGLLLAAKRYAPAIRLYRQVVAQDPENAGAWRALIAAEHESNQDEEALTTIGQMPQTLLEQQQNDPDFLVLVGSVYQSRHDYGRAAKYLEKALTVNPNAPPGVALQLADVYAAQGATQKAYNIYRSELDQDQSNQQAWRGLLNALHQSGRDREALRQMASIPEATRLRLEADPGYLQTLAAIEVSTGQAQAALRHFQRVLDIYHDQNQDVPVGTQIQYGWVLLKAGDDRRLYALVSSLADTPEMTDEQQADFHNLWAAWSMERANALLAAGDQRRALAILQTAAQAFPANKQVSAALAGAYLKAGDARQAVAIYASMDMEHATLAQYQGAIGAALAARDMKHAQDWLEAALAQYKHDPAILKMAAQYEQARGNSERAAAYYRAALDAMGPGPQHDLLSPSGPSATQQLMQLLAPAGRAAVSAPDETLQHGVDVSWQNAPSETTPTLGDFAETEAAQTAPVGNVEQNTATLDRFSAGVNEVPHAADRNAVDVASAIPAVPDEARTSARIEYLRPAPAGMASVQPAAAAQQVPTYRHLGFSNDPNPASRLQAAVQEMNGQAQEPDSGVPAPVEPAPQKDLLSTPASSAKTSELPPLTGPAPARAVRPRTEREQIEDQLAMIQGASSGWIGGSSGVDYRSGQPGFDRLANYTTQIESSGMIAPNVRATVIARPVLLDSGSATSTTTFQQGTLPANTLPYLQSAAGIGGEFQLRAPSFGLSLGYTPHGFLIENTIGSVYVHPPQSHFTLNFDRAPILDTQLSYAGLRDLGSKGPTYLGNVWGGVVANGGELQLAFGDARSGWYIQGGGQYITGKHVQDNRRMDGDAGAYWQVWQHPDYGTLTLGTNFFGMHYDHNLRYFTYGQGGYFSPAAYMLAGVPFTFNGHHGPRFHYRVMGSFGVQAFQENSTPYYPLDPAIQYARDNPYYPENTSVSGNYSLDAEGAYAIAEKWYVGGYLNFNNTRDYAENKVGFYVRYLFRPQPTGENGPTGLFPIQGLRPLQVP